jgi:hypothetical protein
MNATFWFSYDEIKNKTVKNAPLILELQPENKSFLQSWKNMFIKWYGFNSWDKLYIWDSLYDIDFSKWYDYPQIQLNKNISTGFYEIYIESENGKKSNKIKKFISQDSQPQVRFEVKDTNKNEFYYNNSSSDALFQMNITNGIEDVYISQLEFIVQWDKNLSDFWEIDLYINNKKIDHTFVDKDWKIIFLKELILEKNNWDIVLEIKKSDKFYAQWKYRISYLWHKTSTSLSNQQVFIDKKVLNGNYFTVWAKDFFNCYNFDWVNQNCDELEEDTINNEENNTEESKWDNASNNSDKQNNTQEKDNQKLTETNPNSNTKLLKHKV